MKSPLIIYRLKYQTVIISLCFFLKQKNIGLAWKFLRNVKELVLLERLVVIEKYFKNINAAVSNMV